MYFRSRPPPSPCVQFTTPKIWAWKHLAQCPLESGSEGCKNVEIFESGELVQQQAAHCKEGEETSAIEILMFSLVLFPFFSPSFFFFFPCSPLVLLFWGISAAAHCKEGGGSSSHWNIDGPEAEALPYLTVLPFLSISCQILMNKYWFKCKYKYKYNYWWTTAEANNLPHCSSCQYQTKLSSKYR